MFKTLNRIFMLLPFLKFQSNFKIILKPEAISKKEFPIFIKYFSMKYFDKNLLKKSNHTYVEWNEQYAKILDRCFIS